MRYAVDSRKSNIDLNWKPLETEISGLEKTVNWFIENQKWWRSIKDNKYNGSRLGINIKN